MKIQDIYYELKTKEVSSEAISSILRAFSLSLNGHDAKQDEVFELINAHEADCTSEDEEENYNAEAEAWGRKFDEVLEAAHESDCAGDEDDDEGEEPDEGEAEIAAWSKTSEVLKTAQERMMTAGEFRCQNCRHKAPLKKYHSGNDEYYLCDECAHNICE